MASKTITDLGGFVKLDRKILNWEWWDDINVFRLFVTILLMANWENRSWRGREIKRGQIFTSISSLSKKSGLTIKQTRTALDKLIMTHELTSEVASDGTLLTVVNYDVYQSDKKKRASKGQTKKTEKTENGENWANDGASNRANSSRSEISDNKGSIQSDNVRGAIKRASNKANEGQTKGKRQGNNIRNKEVIKNVIKEQQEQQRGGGFATIDLNELLSVDDIVNLGKEYADVDSLIREVEYDANLKGKRIRNPYGYVCGYAINVGWPRK